MSIALFATLQCAPGKRNEVFAKIAQVTEIALCEPEPLTLFVCFPTPLQAPKSPDLRAESSTEEIYFFERFQSAETRKSGTPKSTPAFYNLLSEMQTAKPPLLLGAPKVELLREQYVDFQEGIEGQVAVGSVFVQVVKNMDGKHEGDGEETNIEELIGGADGYLLSGKWIGETEIWKLYCWEGEKYRSDGGQEDKFKQGKGTGEETFNLVAKTGYVRKRVEELDGTKKISHDIQILYK
ncbi:hypothetical protein PILCRDRAFT_829042 [Piloderma croceum F 1598]|uniref:ABM domain-containing protein n=1 Tax=Piloderma croceum (strain F 1598) TaxID=765440 RepID=A0A0C3ELV3_PILCF|nr:hypothetical protein PILCRDRAFT_829042 [Piloderma croceum F 1598]